MTVAVCHILPVLSMTSCFHICGCDTLSDGIFEMRTGQSLLSSTALLRLQKTRCEGRIRHNTIYLAFSEKSTGAT